MKGGTLFSGIGAPEVAMPWVDWRWCAEIDAFASAVMKHRHPSIPNLGDVNEIEDAEPVDLVVFGSPCQSFSVAGKRLGLDDPRGNLALVGLRVVGKLRPRWVVWENVPGVLSSDGGQDFGAFLGLLGQLGYGFAYAVLDAQHFGVPQRRRRVFVVGYFGDWRGAAAVLFEPESLRGDSAPRREAGERVARTLEASADRSGSRTPELACAADSLIAFQAHGGDVGADTLPHLRATGTSAGNGGPTIAFSAKDHGADAGDTAPTLRAGGHDRSHANAGVMPAIVGHFEQNSMAGRGTLGWNDGDQPLRPVKPQGDHQMLVTDTVRSHPRPGSNSVGAVAIDWKNSAGGPNSEDGTGRGTPLVAVPLLEIGKRTNGDGYRDGDGIGQDGDPMYSLQAGAQHGVMTAVPIKNALASGGNGATRNSINGADNDPMWTLDQRSQHGVMTLAIRGRGDSHDLEYRDDGIANAILTPNGGRAGIGVGAVAFDTTQITSPGNVSSPKPGNPCHPLASTAHPPAVAFSQNGQGTVSEASDAYTLSAEHGMQNDPYVRQAMSVRRLTPGECLKLQGFPPDYLDIQYRGKPAADGPKYRATGNSMAVPVVRWIGERIRLFEELAARPARAEAAD